MAIVLLQRLNRNVLSPGGCESLGDTSVAERLLRSD